MMVAQITAENAGDPFFETQCILYTGISECIIIMSHYSCYSSVSVNPSIALYMVQFIY